MCYRCTCCQGVVGPKQPQRRFVLYRERPLTRYVKPVLSPHDETSDYASIAVQGTVREIAQELPVCDVCYRLLEGGLSWVVVQRVRRPVVTVNANVVADNLSAKIEAPKPRSVHYTARWKARADQRIV